MTEPIRPDEVGWLKKNSLPSEVIDVFNELIASKYDGYRAIVLQKTAAALIASRMSVPIQRVYDNHWLDAEEIFRDAGWEVEYDKPGYCETYEASFTFRKKRR